MPIINVSNTNLTDVIRSALKQLGDDAMLVKATANKDTKVEWFKGKTKGVALPTNYPTSHTESFTKGEKILLVKGSFAAASRGSDFLYYNDDENQWYMLHTQQVMSNFTIEKSIRADVTKVREKTKMSVDKLYALAEELESKLSGGKYDLSSWKADNNTVKMAVSVTERRSSYPEILKSNKEGINSMLLKIKSYFDSIGGVSVSLKLIDSDAIRIAEGNDSTGYSEYEIEVTRNLSLTIK